MYLLLHSFGGADLPTIGVSEDTVLTCPYPAEVSFSMAHVVTTGSEYAM